MFTGLAFIIPSLIELKPTVVARKIRDLHLAGIIRVLRDTKVNSLDPCQQPVSDKIQQGPINDTKQKDDVQIHIEHENPSSPPYFPVFSSIMLPLGKWTWSSVKECQKSK